MQRYSVQAKLFALDERKSGKKWKEIQHDIHEKFKVPPPSLRILEKWQKTLNREKLSQIMIEESQKALPATEEAVLQQMTTGLLPVLWKAREAGGDMERDAWLWFFSVLERQLGQEKFEQFLQEYRKRRQKSQGNQVDT